MLHFDHHCKWLNNCIGKKNYKSYSYLIGSFEILNLIISISGACTISGIVKKNIFYDNLHTNFHLTVILENAYLSMLILMEILALLIVIINGQLIGFHIFLGFKRLTTYQYIIETRKRKNKYKISSLKIINDREAVEEVPLEEVFEPYMDNPQFEEKERGKERGKEEGFAENRGVRISPENFAIPQISESDKSSN